MLLEDVAQILPAVDVDEIKGYSSAWTDEDIQDAAAHSARYLESLFPDDDYLLQGDDVHVQAR